MGCWQTACAPISTNRKHHDAGWASPTMSGGAQPTKKAAIWPPLHLKQ